MEILFTLSNLLILPFWLLMILAPRWRWTQRLMATFWPVVALALIYTGLLLTQLGGAAGSLFNPTLAGIAGLLGLSRQPRARPQRLAGLAGALLHPHGRSARPAALPADPAIRAADGQLTKLTNRRTFMKITILNGALPGDDFTDSVQNMLAAQLAGPDQPVRSWTLRDEKISFCLGCFECWTKYPGQCRIADTGQGVTASIINSDLVVYLSPVTFGGYSSELKKALDRSIGLILPFFTRIQGEVHHKPRYENFPRLLGIGVLPAPNPEQERIFTSLLERNAINMHASSSAAGFVYRNQDIPHGRADLEKLLRKTGWEQPHFVLEGAG